MSSGDQKVKEMFIEQGLHVDWLVRAHTVNSIEGLVYLSEQRHKWAEADQKVIFRILQDYKNSDGELLPEHNPAAPINRKRGTLKTELETFYDVPQVRTLTCELLDMVKEEPSIWDKIRCVDFGCHQRMRQAWCSISLKLGGWGAIQHVHMLKQLYRKKRDLYNVQYLRSGREFEYCEKLSFLKDVLEMAKNDLLDKNIQLDEHLKTATPIIDFDAELLAAPAEIQQILREISEKIDKVTTSQSPGFLAEYLATCCNEVVKHRETLATAGLGDDFN